MVERTLEERLRSIEDRAAISDILKKYAFSIDRRQWDDFASCFAGEIEVNLIRTNGWVTFALSDYVKLVSGVFNSYTATQHLTANEQITVEGDSATAWSTLNATHHQREAVGDQFQQQVGYYEWQLARASRWQITKVRQVLYWQRGNQQIFEKTVS
jgi:SnoaL-like domain